MKWFLTLLLSITATMSEDPNSLIVHEWGTFTSIAGEDGNAITWLPWGGPSDLPCFVDRFKNKTKSSYSGKVRMETPVLYFYTQKPATVNVQVRFRQGLITEWFPAAAVTPEQYGDDVANPGFVSTITWNAVKIQPNTSALFPHEQGPSHYYAARDTDAAPVESGSQHEKFLFYRGLGDFEVPISATVAANGAIDVKATAPVPAMIFFENRNGRIRFQTSGRTTDRAVVTLPSFSSDLSALHQELERALVDAGLYAKEAAAMVETWRDSWFEEGARLLYVVPQSTVDSVLPLQISPAPTKIARVFVGRVELMTPATIGQIEQAIRAGDAATLERYGRFLEPARSRIVAKMSVSDREKAEKLLQPVASSYFARTSSHCQ